MLLVSLFSEHSNNILCDVKILPKFDRSSYFLNTKVGRYDLETEKMFDFSTKKVFESVEKSLSLLNVDYVDVLQVTIFNSL